jgi:transcriptional regulator with XRE-family HTH domain
MIAKARNTLGLDQADLARLLDCKQQTVSRWEAGTSRPRAAQIPSVATVLNSDPDHFFALAGYATPSPAIASFAQPFPVDRLDPETFERFVEYLLSQLYPADAQVQRAGTSGHKQDGLDITVVLPNQARHSFQCKRVTRFGPAEVMKAVTAHTATADKKYLVLSRVASPQAAEALREFPDWELWDKEVLSRKIRLELSPDDQDRLVDIFFRGQRQALLGRSEAGPWLTTDEFFEPFARRGAIFSHSWNLKGREAEIAALQKAIDEDTTPIVLVTGPGGIGKSRILKEALQTSTSARARTAIRFLSSSAELSRDSFAKLGPGPKLLVIDDAHDRDGLSALFEYAAVPRNNARVLLAARPYAESRIKREAAIFGIGAIPSITIDRLATDQMVSLVQDVLREFGGSPDWAQHIAHVARDCPLVAVMAARVIAREGIPSELAKNHDDLRNIILEKFRRVITGELGTPTDQKLIPGVLDVLALVQPFHIEDPQLIDLLRTVKGFDESDVSRVLRLLAEGGIVYRRGHQYRLMPDLLGDYIIETSCLGSSDRLSPFAERVFESVSATLLQHVLVNLGRLDWRKAGGDPSDSRMLDNIWSKLNDIENEYDPRFEAIRSVAIFQPKKALDFVQSQIIQGRVTRGLSKILRSIAYNTDYLNDACELLWALGHNDEAELGRHPEHPVRILSELCGFEENKPLEFVRLVFEFGLGLLDRADAWDGHYTPLEILKPVLSSEGVTTTSNGRNIVMSPFTINLDVVSPLRETVIARVLDLLNDPRPRVARQAADFMDAALRAPMGIMGSRVSADTYEKYQAEFIRTLNSLETILRAGTLHPAVVIGIVRAVHWHAQYGATKSARAAQAVMDALPTDLGFRIRAGLSDGFGQIFLGRFDEKTWQANLDAWIAQLTGDLRQAHSNPEELRRALESALRDIEEAQAGDNSSHVLIFNLLRSDLELARAFVADAIARPDSRTRRFLSVALNEILSLAPDEGRALTRRFLNDADIELARSAAAALGGLRREPDQEDADLMAMALSSADASTATNAVHAVWSWRTTDTRILIDLVKRVRLDAAPLLADRLFMTMAGTDRRLLSALDRADVEHFLKRMLHIPALEGYWVQEFLIDVSRRYPHELANFFFERVELASSAETFGSFRPANHGPYAHTRQLRIRESSESTAVLQRAWAWLRENEHRDYYFRHNAADVFDALFLSADGAGVDNDMVALFDTRLDTATPGELRLISQILRNSPHNFVFVHKDFVSRFLNRCKGAGAEWLSQAHQDLYASAISGVRSSIVGEPAPRDLEMLAGAKDVLKKLSRLSPAYKLYDDIRRSAEYDIERSKRDAEGLDDE